MISRRLAILALAFSSLMRAQHTSEKVPVPLSLKGGGRACSGYLYVRPHAVTWKWSFGICRSHGWTVARDGKDWVFTLTQTKAEAQGCPMQVIAIAPTFPDQPIGPGSLWGVEGYRNLADRQHHDDQMACPMQQ